MGRKDREAAEARAAAEARRRTLEKLDAAKLAALGPNPPPALEAFALSRVLLNARLTAMHRAAARVDKATRALEAAHAEARAAGREWDEASAAVLDTAQILKDAAVAVVRDRDVINEWGAADWSRRKDSGHDGK